ncbi:Rad3-related DNA helicase [Eubacterium uniforme]|uniref:Rad3-related DNA helicase n=2 Tax=Eubacterium uniforme TaxID=39495 RepID=A0A1T4VI85_9FIRM|nr:Rad3-related DNA helicase [Eubacterium uniforme]
MDGNVKISVRNLVEFMLRYGDIDNSSGTGDVNAMLEGARIHRKIQNSMGSNYSSEVPLKLSIPYEEFDIVVDGRADGIIKNDDGFVIDEIKGIYKDVKRIEEPELLHIAQAKCYGYIYLHKLRVEAGIEEEIKYENDEKSDDEKVDEELNKEVDNDENNKYKQIDVQITYCNIETEEIKRIKRTFGYTELKEWFKALVDEYYIWEREKYYHHIDMCKSVENLRFPFEYRKGQKELAINVYKAINMEKNLFALAPTGVGKTIAMVYSAVQNLGRERAEKIFYLTAKTITRTVANDAYAILRKNGLNIKTVTLTAKEKICVLEKTNCNPDMCEYAKGHFDRINDVLFEIITNEDVITREVIEEYAFKYKVCPFELSLDVSNFVDGIICDYNYVYDPQASLKRYFANGQSGAYIFLVDEAHNLVERGRKMYSASLKKEDVLEIKNIIEDEFGIKKSNLKTKENSKEGNVSSNYNSEEAVVIASKLVKKLESVNKELLKLRKECDDGLVYYENVGNLYLKMIKAQNEFEALLAEGFDIESKDKFLEFYFNLISFIKIHELVDDNYEIYGELDYYNNFIVNLYCINPSTNLKACTEKGISTVFFSATMLPINHYKELLTGDVNEYAVYIDSPFAKDNRCIVCDTSVSSKYTRRGENEYKNIYSSIRNIIECKNGNYMVFFPSYKMLENIKDIMEEDGFDEMVNIVCQKSNMTEEEKEEFLARFDVSKHQSDTKSLVGLCVLGGIFSEGIDLTEESLIGSIIVGTGLPQVCDERNVIKEYFDSKGRDGFDFAYKIPGMNKVLQAAGRVIRTDTDRGVIALLDDRFNTWQYKQFFPREWDDVYFGNTNDIVNKIKEFWKEM